MATINFNGLASGLDTKSIVEQLTQIRQRQLISPISGAISDVKSKKSALTPINTAATALRTAAKALNDTDNASYNTKTTDSSDTSTVRITATDTSTAVNGTYSITSISQLAQPDRLIFEGVANSDVSQFGSGTLDITYNGTTNHITIDSTNNTLEGIRNAINDADFGVTASIINDGSEATPYRLILTSDDTGSDAAITHNIDSVLSLVVDGTSTDLSNEPRNASFRINSLLYTSATNTVEDAIPGVTFELLDTETTDTITLKVKQDTSSIINKVQSFVTSLNGLRDALKGAIDPDTNNKFGPLGHDRLLQDAYYEIGRISASRVVTAGVYASLAEIGITADRKGKYTIDSGKLTTALENNVDVVRKIFQGTTGEDGIAEKIYSYTDNMTNPIGSIANRQKQYDDTSTRLSKILSERLVALSNYQKKLQAQFNKLETSISALKGRQDQLTGLASTISGVGNN